MQRQRGGLGRLVGQHQLVGAVGAESQLGQRAGEARARLDQREQAARRHVQARQRAAQHAQRLAHEPVLLVGQHQRVVGQHGGGIAFGLQHPSADVEFVGAHVQDGVVQLTCHLQRVPGGTGGFDAGDVGGLLAARGFHGEGGDALGAVDGDIHIFVGNAVGAFGALHLRQLHALGASGAVAALGQLGGTLGHEAVELLRLDHGIDQTPVHGLLAAHAFAGGAEDVGQVVAHVTLVGHAGQAAGARQHAQQRHFRQADAAAAVVDQHDVVAGQGQLVAAAGAGAVQRGDEFQAAVLAAVLYAVAGLVGELAEVDLPRMAGQAQHEDVGAGAEHAVLAAGDHHGAHFGVFEADALQRVVQFDVHAQVVAVQLELVAGADAGVLVDVDGQFGHRAVERQLDVAVLARLGAVVDLGVRLAHAMNPRVVVSGATARSVPAFAAGIR